MRKRQGITAHVLQLAHADRALSDAAKAMNAARRARDLVRARLYARAARG